MCIQIESELEYMIVSGIWALWWFLCCSYSVFSKYIDGQWFWCFKIY